MGRKKKRFDELKCLGQPAACLLAPAAAERQGRGGWGKELGGTSAFRKKRVSDVHEHGPLWILALAPAHPLWAAIPQPSMELEVSYPVT